METQKLWKPREYENLENIETQKVWKPIKYGNLENMEAWSKMFKRKKNKNPKLL